MKRLSLLTLLGLLWLLGPAAAQDTKTTETKGEPAKDLAGHVDVAVRVHRPGQVLCGQHAAELTGQGFGAAGVVLAHEHVGAARARLAGKNPVPDQVDA